MKEGMKKTTCGSCGGTGTRTFTIQSGFQMASTCASCGGSGSVAPPGSNCGTCAGVGKVRERRSVEVKIPPGVDDGMKIRIDGKGDAPLGGKGRTGDLFVRVNVIPSKTFTRQGSNIYQNVSVPFYTAILGGKAPVKTLDRDVEVRVPGGTQPGEEMVLRGKGVKKLYKDEHGDLVVRFNVSMPRCVILPMCYAESRSSLLISIVPSLPLNVEFSNNTSPKLRSPVRPRTIPRQPHPPPLDHLRPILRLNPILPKLLPLLLLMSMLPGSPNKLDLLLPMVLTVSFAFLLMQLHEVLTTTFDLAESTWWNTMDNDISSTKRTETSSPSSTTPPPPSTSETPPQSSPAAKEEQREDHTLLGDLWKGAKRFFGSSEDPLKSRK